MNDSVLKFKTIQFINGIGYIYEDQIEYVSSTICDTLNIEKSDHHYKIIKEAIELYFTTQNN